MNMVQIVPLDIDCYCGLTALPNEQFLANTCERKEFFLIDSNGKLKETLHYQNDEDHLVTSALIGTKYLVIITDRPGRFNFYDR